MSKARYMNYMNSFLYRHHRVNNDDEIVINRRIEMEKKLIRFYVVFELSCIRRENIFYLYF